MTVQDHLVAAYRAVHRLPDAAPLPASAEAQITLMAQGVEAARAGEAGFGWTYASAMQWVLDSARATTEVAALSYGFFADLTLGTAGLDYLVSAGGPNPNNLNSAYYQSFNIENRYINFAVNLVKHGEAKQTFLERYGAEATIHETLRKAWQALFGEDKPLGEIVDLLSDEVPDGRGGLYTRGEYFVELGGDGGNGLGTRAAAVGWLLAEAAKAGAGPYVSAVDAFLADLAFDGRTTSVEVFLSLYGPGGDLARGGPGDAGMGGESARFEHDWDVDVARPAGSAVHALATDGNDTLSSAVSDIGGLDAGRRIFAGGGNDVVVSSNGTMSGHIDAGAGNDLVLVERFDGRITTGAGYDTVDIGSFAPLRLSGGEPVSAAWIDDFQKGQDLLIFPAVVGPGVKASLALVPEATLGQALAAYSAITGADQNTVFEWGGDTYIYHQNAHAGVDAGDGLVRLAGVTGLAVGNGAQAQGDILFGA